MQRFKIVPFVAEFRGVSAGREATNKKGEKVVYRDVKFEYELDESDVQVLPVAAGDFAHCKPPFDWTKLQKGDKVLIHGETQIADRGERWNNGDPMVSRFSIYGGRVELVTPDGEVALGRPVLAAAK